jgi:hypothetical protein
MRRNIFTSRKEEEEHRLIAVEQGPQQDPMAAAVNVGGRALLHGRRRRLHM